MTLWLKSLHLADRLISDRSGAVGVLYALVLVPLVAAVGVAVDYARAEQVRAALQEAADLSALAGASAFTGSAAASSASTVATNFMNGSKATLPANSGLTYSVTPTAGSGTKGNTVTVSASTQVATTLMEWFLPSLTVSVSATAKNPITTVSFGTPNAAAATFGSSAYDANTILWYVVPPDNSVPPLSAMTVLFSNVPKNPSCKTVGNPPANDPASVSFQLSANQQIGFALQNVTGGICGYGSNQYGGTQGSTHYFYSHLFPPSAVAYPKVTQDCSLQVAKVTSLTSPLAEVKDSCFTVPFQYAAPTCAQLSGMIVQFDWNDMGGETDDKDYNDAWYNFTCTPAAGANTSAKVVLTQ